MKICFFYEKSWFFTVFLLILGDFFVNSESILSQMTFEHFGANREPLIYHFQAKLEVYRWHYGENRGIWALKSAKSPPWENKIFFFQQYTFQYGRKWLTCPYKFGLMKMKCICHHSSRNFESYGRRKVKFQHWNQENSPLRNRNRHFSLNTFRGMARNDLHGHISLVWWKWNVFATIQVEI